MPEYKFACKACGRLTVTLVKYLDPIVEMTAKALGVEMSGQLLDARELAESMGVPLADKDVIKFVGFDGEHAETAARRAKLFPNPMDAMKLAFREDHPHVGTLGVALCKAGNGSPVEVSVNDGASPPHRRAFLARGTIEVGQVVELCADCPEYVEASKGNWVVHAPFAAAHKFEEPAGGAHPGYRRVGVVREEDPNNQLDGASARAATFPLTAERSFVLPQGSRFRLLDPAVERNNQEADALAREVPKGVDPEGWRWAVRAVQEEANKTKERLSDVFARLGEFDQAEEGDIPLADVLRGYERARKGGPR
jgi:hypothetical protein